MTTPTIGSNLYVRTLRSRNIPYETRNRQITIKIVGRQKPNISPRQNTLQTKCEVKTSDISMQLQSCKDMIIGNTLEQEDM